MSLKSDLKKCRANMSSKGVEKLQTNFANYCQRTFKEWKDEFVKFQGSFHLLAVIFFWIQIFKLMRIFLGIQTSWLILGFLILIERCIYILCIYFTKIRLGTSLKANLHQDINTGFAFSRCLNGKFHSLNEVLF